MQLLVSAWNDVSETTIVNCLKKVNISESGQSIAMNDEDDPFKELKEDLKELRQKVPCLVPENMTAEILAQADDAVITTPSTHTDGEILER